MGLVHTELQLSNAREPRLAPIVVSALADSGALHLRIPAHVALQLDFEELERREVTLANGARHLVPYVGPLKVRFGNRTCFTGAMVLGDEILLGSIPVDAMDVPASHAQSRASMTTSHTNTRQRGTGRAGQLRRAGH